MKIITICGSMKFKDEIENISFKLAKDGYCILTPLLNVPKDIKLNEDDLKNLKEEHFKRIEISDAIYVVNKDNYIGSSTKLEIEHAKSLGKEIIYLNK